MTDAEKDESTESEQPETTEADAPEADSEDKFEFVDDPEFEVDYKGECAYEVKVKLASSNEKKQAEEMYEELRSDTELPGFRRGRAPLKLVEKKFSKAVKGEVEAKLVSAAFQKLVEDEDLHPIGQPDIDGVEELAKREAGAALEFTLKFEVAPRVELGTYRGIKIERPIVKIDENDVEESLNEMRGHYAVYDTLEGGMAAEEDQVIIDFEGTIDGEGFQGGSAENYPYILGSKRFFPEFEAVLLGSSPEDSLTCKVIFPDDYFAENLRGQEADFKITVNEVKRKTLPELNDEFATQSGYENLEDMHEKIKDQLDKGAQERSRQLSETRALQAIVDASTFELPESMIARISGQYIEEEIKRLQQMRIPREALDEREEEIRAGARDRAIANIKSMVTLNEIGTAEGIEVNEDDLEREAATLSQTIGADVETIAAYMAQDDNRNSYIDRIYRTKAMAVILDNAEITDKLLTREEMEAEDSDEAEEES